MSPFIEMMRFEKNGEELLLKLEEYQNGCIEGRYAGLHGRKMLVMLTYHY